jgi:hypothetical protein
MAAKAAGMSYPQLCVQVLQGAALDYAAASAGNQAP